MTKTLAIRMDDQLHAQLSVIAQLEDVSITELIRQAIEAQLAAKRSQPGLADRAKTVLADIDQEAQARRQAVAAMFGDSSSGEAEPAKPTSRSRKVSRPTGDETS